MAKKIWRVGEKGLTLQCKAQRAESVDALVSNTSGAIRAGSTPALGTMRGAFFRKLPAELLIGGIGEIGIIGGAGGIRRWSWRCR